MFGFGGSKKGCCGAETSPDQQYFPTVPTCPGQIPFNAAGCISNKGKFYDTILQDLMLPLSGQQVKAYVCEPGLWSSCQWAAICVASDKIAVLKVTGIGADYILTVNACQDGEPIEDNPPPGTTIKAGSVIYPVPPPWCSDAFCNKINAALANPECACQGVKDCLAQSEEICMSALLEVEEGEEVHAIGGTMLTNEGNENDDPSLWKTCLKKISKIITGFTGRTWCFLDIPETTLAPDIVDGVPVKKRQLVLDGFNCLRAGPPVSSGSCDEELDIQITEDTHHTGEGDNESEEQLNAKGRTFDSIAVCREGESRVLLPSAPCQTIVSGEDEDGNKYWEEQPSGGRDFLFAAQHVLVNGANVNLKNYEKYKRLAGDCKLYAIVSVATSVSGSSSVANASLQIVANGQLIGLGMVVGANVDAIHSTNAYVPLSADSLTITPTFGGVGGVQGSTTYRLRGYKVGGLEI